MDETAPRSLTCRLAEALHAGQTDKAGQPYFRHLERVVRHLLARWPDATHDEIDAAWLHDALEDTAATRRSLIAAGISSEAVRIIEAVTRPEGVEYLRWLEDLAATADRSVLRVKLADNADNRDPQRVALLADGGRRLVERYEPAAALLEAGLRRAG
ncbi:HD domain-containing protein [Ancylobacter sp. 6x-1]|uniref:HD domain-containing protein n=1 Tax=Ancylobacter crimeensis TaxID=2579147 RepID=A0ABT0DFE4_9HYPH|nr:HD domain-containing protein [Ancylobacter crimeensis]MCK0198686.1 HD domain-containing protein [Ancylobacter crimeensis]